MADDTVNRSDDARKARRRAYLAIWRAKNQDKVKAASARFHATHPTAKRDEYHQNKARYSVSGRAWRERNKARLTAERKAAYHADLEASRAKLRERYAARREIRQAAMRLAYWRKRDAVVAATRKRYAEDAEYRARIQAHHRQSRQKYPEKTRAANRAYRAQNRAKLRAKDQAYRMTNPHIRKVWEERNRERLRENQKRRFARLRKESPAYRLSHSLRTRLGQALRRNIKHGSAVRDLGCSLDEFRAYIASRFKSGMTWENWGRRGWHLDHRQALASFDLSDPEQFRQAVHYTNYQPLWASENCSKGARTEVLQKGR